MKPSLAGGFIALVAMGAVLGAVPVWLVVVYGVASLLAWLAYAIDKDAAGAGRRRIPESTLHALALAGGWPGALLAQRQFRHKTVKVSFRRMFWLTVIANVGIVGWLCATGDIHALAR